MVEENKLKKIDTQKLQENIEDYIKKKGYVDNNNQKIHDIKSRFFTEKNKYYSLIFAFDVVKKSYFSSSESEHFGILVCYNPSSGEVKKVINRKIEIGSFKLNDKKKGAEKAIIEKVVEVELEKKSKAIIKLNKKKAKVLITYC